ncbi:MAG TPA: acetate--CoA ligase family protein [Vicinamibacterales bacterium]|nr:acetate--CoA ligase family protein [Vicinamibacterales bacterium]
MFADPVGLAEQLIANARAAGRPSLLEPEAARIVEALDIQIPRRMFVSGADEAERLAPDAIAGDRAVVKVVAAGVTHKTDVGGVVVVPNTPDAIAAAVRAMERRFGEEQVAGYSVAEFVGYDPSFGGEWLLGLRWTDEFGPVLTVGSGGTATEYLAPAFEAGRHAIAFAAGRTTRQQITNGLRRLAVTPLATGMVRRQRPRIALETIVGTVERFSRLAAVCHPNGIAEFEINPLVVPPRGLVALDVLATFAPPGGARRAGRPREKLRHLLRPASLAVMGVSASQQNPGRVILSNVLRAGFDPAAVYVIKAGVDEIDGCRAVAGIRMLPEPVDLLILSVAASQVPEALVEAIDSRLAESVIVIPGGLGEKAGSDALVGQMLASLAESRLTTWRGPLVNGGNCLGIQSGPGRYDTLFIPEHKLTPAASDARAESPLALISQSGAFAVSRTTRLAGVRPRYTITVGNQIDLTIGDYLAYLERDPDVRVFGVYVEGFARLDGSAALSAVERITSDGRAVVLYRAGRTREGGQATASHTAAVAGDYAITRDLFQAAGAIVADSLDDFTELVMLFTLLDGRPVRGRRLGALSNAGYECVAIADNLGPLGLPVLAPRTIARLDALFERHRLSTIVDARNPLDVTPMLNDEPFEEAARAVLDDDHVDVGVIGCVPATPALNTLAPSAAHGEDLASPDAVAARLIRLHRDAAKPFVAIVDAGALYDPFARRLLDAGIPTFRSADRAVRLLGTFVENRYAHTLRAETERWVDAYELPHDQRLTVGE